jgi:uncharacterized membrane protein
MDPSPARGPGTRGPRDMKGMVLVHVVAGGLALLFGFVALSATKGATLHRKSGMLFVYAVLTMALTGSVMATLKGQNESVIGGVLTIYLVTTSLIAVRPPTATLRRVELGAMLMAIALGATCVTFGVQALTSPGGTKGGIPYVVFFMFATVTLLGVIGDVRKMRAGAIKGAPRLIRHLWRMCYAFWITTASFFLGPRERVAKILPEALITPALLALPVVAVIVVMLYWLWRVRLRRNLRGILAINVPQRVKAHT